MRQVEVMGYAGGQAARPKSKFYTQAICVNKMHMSAYTAPSWKLHLIVPKAVNNNVVTFSKGNSFIDVLQAHSFPATFSGQIYKISYFVRAIVKHKQYGEGKAIDIPINIIPMQRKINQARRGEFSADP